MVDPVVVSDDEHATIKKWLSQHGAVSPTTGATLDNTDLVPNIALRSTLEQWLLSC